MTNIKIKIFLGYLQNGELKMFMNQSPTWKNHLLSSEPSLQQVIFQNKDYLGLLLDSSLPYDQLKLKESDIKVQIEHYFPKFDCEKYAIYLFPQIFIS